MSFKWLCIGNGLDEWLSIESKVISVVFYCLSGTTVEVEWQSSGIGLVIDWLRCCLVTVKWQLSCSRVTPNW